jgi:hypothetical protein
MRTPFGHAALNESLTPGGPLNSICRSHLIGCHRGWAFRRSCLYFVRFIIRLQNPPILSHDWCGRNLHHRFIHLQKVVQNAPTSPGRLGSLCRTTPLLIDPIRCIGNWPWGPPSLSSTLTSPKSSAWFASSQTHSILDNPLERPLSRSRPNRNS